MKRFLTCLSAAILAAVFVCVGAVVAFASSESDDLKVEFVDSQSNVIKTTYLEPGAVLDLSDLNATVLSTADGKVKTVEGWYINLGVEISAVGFTYSDIATIGVNKITVYPKMSEESVINTYAMYTVDDFGIARLCGSVADYQDMATLPNKIASAPDGAFVTMLYDKDTPYDIGGKKSISIPAGKTLSFDLNGRMFVQSYGSTSGYGGYLFNVGEKSVFNVYSSASGGAFYQARYNSTNQNNNVFAQGIIGVGGGVDSVDINVGDIYDESGNLIIDCADDFSLYGGTLVFVTSSKNTGEEFPGKINIDVNGGYYYHSMRSGYALFTIQAPDVYINVNGIKVYNNNTTYAIVHDYTGGHMSISHFTAKNSEFICRNKDNTVNNKFYFNMSAESTAYFEDCVIMAQTAAGLKGTITLGAGNIIAGDMLEKAVLEEGVLLGEQSEAVLERYVTHPPLYNSLTSTPPPIIQNPEDEKWYINPIVFDKTQWVYDALMSCEIAGGTYKLDGSKNAVKEVKWFNRAGEQVGETEYWVVGSKLVHKEYEIINGGWYDIECSWCYEDGTLAREVEIEKDGEYTFLAIPQTPIARINGKLASVTLSERITFDLYLPIDSNVTLGTVTSSIGEIKKETVKLNGKDMYRFYWEMPLGSFEVNTVNIKYSVASFGEFANLSSDKSFEYVVELDLLRYADIAADRASCNSNESILIYEIVSYVESVAALNPEFNSESIENLAEFYALYDDFEKHFESGCECKAMKAEEEIDRADSAVDYKQLTKKGIVSFEYIFSLTDVGMKINVKNSSVKIDSITVADASGNLTAIPFNFVEDGNYYLVSGISARYINSVFTIEVNGVTGTYSLGRFIFDFIDDHLHSYEDEKVFKAAAGLFEYAKIAKLYDK